MTLGEAAQTESEAFDDTRNMKPTVLTVNAVENDNRARCLIELRSRLRTGDVPPRNRIL